MRLAWFDKEYPENLDFYWHPCGRNLKLSKNCQGFQLEGKIDSQSFKITFPFVSLL